VTDMKIYAIHIGRDDLPTVVSVDVLRETTAFYYPSNQMAAFGYRNRIDKVGAFTTPRAALENYIARRNQHRANARAVALQCDKQIEHADRLLLEEPAPVDAVDPQAEVSNA
jgi:hypothetical protein